MLFERAYNLKVKAYADAGIDLSKSTGDMLFARALDGYLQTLVLGAGSPESR